MNLEQLRYKHTVEVVRKLTSLLFALVFALSSGLHSQVALAKAESALAGTTEEKTPQIAHLLQEVNTFAELEELFGTENLPEGMLAATTIHEDDAILEACNQMGETLDDQLPGLESTNYLMAHRDQVIPASGDISYVIPEIPNQSFSRLELQPFTEEVETQKVYFLLHLAKNELTQQSGVVTVHVFVKDLENGNTIPYYSQPVSLDGIGKDWQSLVLEINLGKPGLVQSAGVIFNRSDTTKVYADAISAFADNETEVCDFNVFVPFTLNNNYDSPTLIENSPYFKWSDWRDTPENRDMVFNKLPLTESDRVVIDGRILFNTQALNVAINTENGTEAVQFMSLETAQKFWTKMIESLQNPVGAAEGMFVFDEIPTEVTSGPIETTTALFPTITGGALLLPSRLTVDLSAFSGTIARFVPFGAVALAPFLLGSSEAPYSVHSNFVLAPAGMFEMKNYTDKTINDLLYDQGPVVPLHTSMLSLEQLTFLRTSGAILEIKESTIGASKSSWLFVPAHLAYGYEFATAFSQEKLESFITNDNLQTLFTYQLRAVDFTNQETAETRLNSLKALQEELLDMTGNPEKYHQIIVESTATTTEGNLDLPQMPRMPEDVVTEVDKDGVARNGQGIPDEIRQRDEMGGRVLEEALMNRKSINQAITEALLAGEPLSPEQEAKKEKITKSTNRDVATLEQTIQEIEETIQAGKDMVTQQGDTEYTRRLREFLDKYAPRLERHKEILEELQGWRDLLNSGNSPQ